MAYPGAVTFWLEPTDEVAVALRRYADDSTCPGGYHDAISYVGREQARFTVDDGGRRTLEARPQETAHDDPRWPTECSHSCGYQFTHNDRWQDWSQLLYRRTDSGELHVLHQGAAAPGALPAPSGACWNAWWMSGSRRGPDGIYLMVRLPNGRDWAVDGEASNCTRKGEPHACWVRHGDPRQCQVTVDKDGDTCAAGAGSIAAGDYHGFLRAGVLTAG